jgi:serine/threonine-protein kinase
MALAQARDEMGRRSDAADAAVEVVRKRDAWSPIVRTDDFGIEDDLTVPLAALAVHGGRLPRTELDAIRAAWFADWERRGPGSYRPYLWYQGWAVPAETAEEARAALADRQRFAPLPHYFARSILDADAGRVALLAGDAAGAIEALQKATRNCRALFEPIKHTRAHLWLGRALEQTGDVTGACAAYRVVLRRWGNAKPTSVTASEARERSRALRCEAGI